MGSPVPVWHKVCSNCGQLRPDGSTYRCDACDGSWPPDFVLYVPLDLAASQALIEEERSAESVTARAALAGGEGDDESEQAECVGTDGFDGCGWSGDRVEAQPVDICPVCDQHVQLVERQGGKHE